MHERPIYCISSILCMHRTSTCMYVDTRSSLLENSCLSDVGATNSFMSHTYEQIKNVYFFHLISSILGRCGVIKFPFPCANNSYSDGRGEPRCDTSVELSLYELR